MQFYDDTGSREETWPTSHSKDEFYDQRAPIAVSRCTPAPPHTTTAYHKHMTVPHTREILTPMILFNGNRHIPSIPCLKYNSFHRPISFIFGSLLQAPTGILYLCSTTSTNPALIMFSLVNGASSKFLPNFFTASIDIRDQSLSRWSSVTVPSSDFHIIFISISWIQPPGLIHLVC
jgi:hypothetical protein